MEPIIVIVLPFFCVLIHMALLSHAAALLLPLTQLAVCCWHDPALALSPGSSNVA
jgi:hypothetical protein